MLHPQTLAGSKAEPSDPAEPFSLVAPEDRAIVLLARPRFLLKTEKLRILDHEHRCVAALKGKTYTAIRVVPGKHSVIAFMRKDARQKKKARSEDRAF